MRSPVVALAMLVGLPAVGRAESLSLDLFTVQPIDLEPGGELTLEGAVHCHHDGAVLDALSTRMGNSTVPGGLVDAEAGGLRVVWRDPDHHAYRLVATDGAGPACGAAEVPSPCLAPRTLALAQARLLTVAAFAHSLSGDVKVASSRSGGGGTRLSLLVRAPWEYQLAALAPLAALAGWGWLRRRRRRTPAPSQAIAGLVAELTRRLRHGDPVHQRLLVPMAALAAKARRLERERRRGLAEGWPAETQRAANQLDAIVHALLELRAALNQATRAGRADLDHRLLLDLHEDLQLSLDAAHEADASAV
jgi:hypothetical protein